MSAFAPGPWVTDEDAEHEAVLDANGVLVADCCILHLSRTNEACRAHARLIAAAPALYEALLLAVDAMRAPLDDWKGVVERKALDAARAALAAAKGAQS